MALTRTTVKDGTKTGYLSKYRRLELEFRNAPRAFHPAGISTKCISLLSEG
jgi:hypothetical protein